jgi:hypothetical protein
MKKSIGTSTFLGAMCLALIPIAPAQAKTADELASQCRWVRSSSIKDATLSQPADFASGECWGFLGALQTYSRLMNRDGTSVLNICAPAASRLSQFVNIFVLYVDRHPEQGHLDAGFIALKAARNAFPCGSK